jgi:hypothetical protein
VRFRFLRDETDPLPERSLGLDLVAKEEERPPMLDEPRAEARLELGRALEILRRREDVGVLLRRGIGEARARLRHLHAGDPDDRRRPLRRRLPRRLVAGERRREIAFLERLVRLAERRVEGRVARLP